MIPPPLEAATTDKTPNRLKTVSLYAHQRPPTSNGQRGRHVDTKKEYPKRLRHETSAASPHCHHARPAPAQTDPDRLGTPLTRVPEFLPHPTRTHEARTRITFDLGRLLAENNQGRLNPGPRETGSGGLLFILACLTYAQTRSISPSPIWKSARE